LLPTFAFRETKTGSTLLALCIFYFFFKQTALYRNETRILITIHSPSPEYRVEVKKRGKNYTPQILKVEILLIFISH